MIYRELGKTGMKISIISMGCEYVWTAPEEQVRELVQEAVSEGINYFDIFVGTPSTREYFGRALEGVRDKVYLAGHLGCADADGQYVKTRDEKVCRDYLNQFYEKLKTEYESLPQLKTYDEKLCFALALKDPELMPSWP